jgi:hypothetical protein
MITSARAGTSRSDVSAGTTSRDSPRYTPAASYSPPIPGTLDTAPIKKAGWCPMTIATGVGSPAAA